MTRKALIVKLGAIGDVVSVLPAARKLHQSGVEIDWLCGEAVASLLSCYAWLRPIVVKDKELLSGHKGAALSEVLRTWKKLFGRSYDLCATLQYDKRFSILTLPVRSHRSIALQRNDRDFQLVSERYHVAEYARILCEESDGYSADNLAPVAPDRLPPNPMVRSEAVRISLVPGGAKNLLRDDAQRRWPIDEYVALARLLMDKGYEVVLTGGPGDHWVEPHFAGLPVKNCIGQWEVPQTIAFYQSCDCVVTHDTGPLHLAGLTSCGLVGLFGPTAPSKALPRRDRAIAIWGGERLPCRPCYDGNSFAECKWIGCMISITPQKVISAIESLLADPQRHWAIESL